MVTLVYSHSWFVVLITSPQRVNCFSYCNFMQRGLNDYGHVMFYHLFYASVLSKGFGVFLFCRNSPKQIPVNYDSNPTKYFIFNASILYCPLILNSLFQLVSKLVPFLYFLYYLFSVSHNYDYDYTFD